MMSLRPRNAQTEQNPNPGALKKGVIGAGGRAALGDVGNVNGLQNRMNGKNLKAGPPTKGLTRAKAVTNLKEVPINRPQPIKTRSAEKREKALLKDDPAPMEVEALPQIELKDEAQTIDIDVEDMGNPQLCAEYVNEIYVYLRQLEDEQSVKSDYLANQKTTIKPRMRNMMVDWLIDVHVQFNLLQETLYLAIAVMDRYLGLRANEVATKELQLIGVASMFIAAKYEEMYPPELGDYVYITDNAYEEKQILKAEIRILDALSFDLGRPLPLNFLRRNSKAGMVDAITHTIAKYAMEICVIDYEMAHIKPSVTAAAALAFAMACVDPDAPLSELWNPTLVRYTSYRLEDFSDCLQMIARKVISLYEDHVADLQAAKAKNEAPKRTSKKNKAVFRKYSNKKFSKVALLPSLRADNIRAISQGEF